MRALINEVRKRPILWKKTHNRNRVAVDKEWSTVAMTLGIAKDVAKNKWKNIRDHFIKELKRIPGNHLNLKNPRKILTDYKGRWHYFSSMLFLKNECTAYSPSTEENGSEEDSRIAENILEETNYENNDYSNNKAADSEQSMMFESSLEDAPFLQKEANIETRCSTPLQMPLPINSFPIKTEITESPVSKLYNNDVVQIEGKTLFVIPGNKDNDDEDFYFLKSLLPYLKQLPPIRKLQVRTQFQNILIQELSSLNKNN